MEGCLHKSWPNNPPTWRGTKTADWTYEEEKQRGRRFHLSREDGATQSWLQSVIFLMKFLPCYPSLLCANTRSAVNKMDEISTTLKTKSVSCFVATETWFRDIHHHNMFCIEDFTCFRDDRTGRVGGGVAIWAKQTLNAKRVPLPLKPDYIECVAITLASCYLVIRCYFPPDMAISKRKE